MCFTRCLFHSNNVAGSAALAEVCALLSAVLVLAVPSVESSSVASFFLVFQSVKESESVINEMPVVSSTAGIVKSVVCR